MDAKQQIEGWLDEKLSEEEFAHAFPVEINVHANNRVEVYVDSDESVSFALCRRISRHLEEKLDETLILGEKYTLEVSSPGTSRPLVNPRQYPKHVGRTLKVKTAEDTTVEGELTSVTDEGIVLKEERVERNEKNKRVKVEYLHELPFGEFSDAKVQLSFR